MCSANWLNSRYAQVNDPTDHPPVFTVDGKTLRRSQDHANGQGSLHSATVRASDYRITLAQVATEVKSIEITAVPEVLKLVNVAGAIVTIDALGTQTAIAKQIVDCNGDFVMTLKRNQGTLHQSVIDYVNQQLENDFPDGIARRPETEAGHGRLENHLDVPMPAPKDLSGFDRWTGLTTIGVAMLSCLRDGKKTYDCRYFVSSLSLRVKQFARAVRYHWGIENSCYWT